MPTIIESQIAEYHIYQESLFSGFTIDDLKGRRRTQPLCNARFRAMDKIYISTQMTYAEVGEIFGGRTPATVLNAIKKVNYA